MKLQESTLKLWLEQSGLTVHAEVEPDRLVATLGRLKIEEWPAELQCVILDPEQIPYYSPATQSSFIAMYVVLPDIVVEEHLFDVLQLISVVNKACSVGQFNYDAVDRHIYLRFTMPATEKAADEKLLRCYLNTMSETLEIYGRLLRRVARGEESLQQVQEQLRRQVTSSLEESTL